MVKGLCQDFFVGERIFSFICRSKIYSPAPTPHSLCPAPPSPARALCHLSQKYFFDILNIHKIFSLAELGVQWSLWDEKYLQVLCPCSYLEVWGRSKLQVLQEMSSHVANTPSLQHTLQGGGEQPLGMYGTALCHSASLCCSFFLFLLILCSLLGWAVSMEGWAVSMEGWVGIHGELSFINSHQCSFITCAALPPCGFTYLLTCSFGISNI